MIIADPIWRNPPFRPDPRLCFVIMPFREKWSDYIYKEYIKPLVESQGITVKRSDEMFGQNVLEDIWGAIYSSRLVVADISAPNENVFYELGIAHTLGKKTIILTQNIERVPFDLRTQRIVVYSDDHPGYSKLSLLLPKHVGAILAESIDEGQLVRSIVGGYAVRHAKQTIEIFGDKLQNAQIIDRMDVVGVRENVVMLNKLVEEEGHFSNIRCNHRFVYSDRYPNQLRLAILFEEPYLQVGISDSVEIGYTIEEAFKDDGKRWSYDISVDCTELTFELITPLSYKGVVQIVKAIKTNDYVLQSIVPSTSKERSIYTGIITSPELGATYAIKWT